MHVSHSAARRIEYDVAISPSTKYEAGYCCRRYLDVDSHVCMPWLLFMFAQIVYLRILGCTAFFFFFLASQRKSNVANIYADLWEGTLAWCGE